MMPTPRWLRALFPHDVSRKPVRRLRPAELEDRSVPATMYAVDAANTLLTFDSATPGTVTATPISSLGGGEVVLGIDVRPATGGLYGLAVTDDGATRTGRIYTINPATGAASPAGAAFSTALADTDFWGVDFNPNVDLIRITNSGDQNLRVSPNTGVLVGTDMNLNPAGQAIHDGAYTNNAGGAVATTLYALSSGTNSLQTIGGLNGNPSPNGGALTTIGSTGIVNTDGYAFDIEAGPNAGRFTAAVGGSTGLYTIDLTTGAATLVGAVGDGTPLIRGLTSAQTAVTVGGTAGNDSLVVTATGATSGTYSLNGGPAVAFSGASSFAFLGGAGNDTLTLNCTGGVLNVPVRYFGGESAGDNDTLAVTGYNVGTVTVNHTGPEAGTVQIGAGAALISFAQLEPLTLGGTATDLVISLPAGADAATLQDDGTTGNNISRLTSAGTFEATTFTHPTGSLTITGGTGDTLTLNTADSFAASVSASGFNSIAANTLATTGSLSLTATNGITQTGGPVTVTGTTSLNGGAGGVSVTATANSFQGLLSASSTAGGVAVAATGTVTVGTIGAAGQLVSINAAGSVLDDLDDTTRITADTVSVTAGIDIGAKLTTGKEDVDTAANTVSGTSANSPLTAVPGIWFDDVDGVNWQNVSTVNGVVVLTSAGNTTVTSATANGTNRNTNITASAGSLTVGTASSAGGSVSLKALAGGILDGNGAGTVNVSAAITGTFTAGAGGVNLDTTLTNLSLNSGGNATIRETDGLNLNAVTLTNATTGNDFTLTAGGAVTQTAAVVVPGQANLNAGANDITLTTAGNNFNNITVAGAAVSLLENTIFNITGATVSTNLTLDTSASTVTQSGAITGLGGLIKRGTGTVRLTAANTYTGSTQVQAGVLLVNGSNTAATGAISVSAGAVLGGNGTLGGAVSGSGTIDPGATFSPPSTGILSAAAGVTVSGVSTYSFHLNGNVAGTSYDQLSAAGTVTLTGSTLNLLVGYTPAGGHRFDVVTNTAPVTGTFTTITGFGGAPVTAVPGFGTPGENGSVFDVPVSGGGSVRMILLYNFGGNNVSLFRYDPPTLTSITRTTINPTHSSVQFLTNQTTVTYQVVFSAPINGLNTGNFGIDFSTGPWGTTLMPGGTTPVSVVPVGTAPATTWTVTVSTGTGNGQIGMTLLDPGSATPPNALVGVTDQFGLPVLYDSSDPEQYTAAVYDVDKVAPRITQFQLLYGNSGVTDPRIGTRRALDINSSRSQASGLSGTATFQSTVPWQIAGVRAAFTENVTGFVGGTPANGLAVTVAAGAGILPGGFTPGLPNENRPSPDFDYLIDGQEPGENGPAETLVWTFSGPISLAQALFNLGGIRDAAGNAVQASNGVTSPAPNTGTVGGKVTQSVPSLGGTAPYTVATSYLVPIVFGDVTGDRRVTSYDLTLLQNVRVASAANPAAPVFPAGGLTGNPAQYDVYRPQAAIGTVLDGVDIQYFDVTGDGRIDTTDQMMLLSRIGTGVAGYLAGPPTVPPPN